MPWRTPSGEPMGSTCDDLPAYHSAAVDCLQQTMLKARFAALPQLPKKVGGQNAFVRSKLGSASWSVCWRRGVGDLAISCADMHFTL